MLSQIHYSSKIHKITCDDNVLIEQITVHGIITDNEGAQISIPYTGLEKVVEISLEYKDKRTKKIKKKNFLKTSLISNSFYDGVKAFQYHINKPTTFILTYKIIRNDLMYISTLDFFSYYKCDSVIYELTIPHEKTLVYNLPIEIENLKIDSVEKLESKKYIFSQYENSNTPISELKISNSNYILSNYSSQVVRIHISNSSSPKKSLNEWYNNLIKGTGELNESSKIEVDSLLRGVKDEDIIIKELLRFVQTKIRYLDIEDGINAFVPRNVNEILSKRQGDCKDMSNLLVKALTYKGVKAHLALSSSLSHRFNLDFPNIASSNHVVCVVLKDEKWLVVDATDKYSQYPFPSSHTQGRNLFVVNDDGGFFYKVEKITYENNLDSIYADLSIENGKIIGKINAIKKGYSNRKYIAIKDYYSKDMLTSKVNKIASDDFASYDISNLNYNITTEESTVTFNISQRKTQLTKVKNKTYLPVKSLINELHSFPIEVKQDEKLITYGTVYKKFKINLNLNSEFTLVNKLDNSCDYGSLKFQFSIEQDSEKSLLIECALIIDEVELKGDELNEYRLLNQVIQDVINKSIIYVKK